MRPEDVAASIPCGPDVDGIVAAVGQFTDAGFTDVAERLRHRGNLCPGTERLGRLGRMGQ